MHALWSYIGLVDVGCNPIQNSLSILWWAFHSFIHSALSLLMYFEIPFKIPSAYCATVLEDMVKFLIMSVYLWKSRTSSVSHKISITVTTVTNRPKCKTRFNNLLINLDKKHFQATYFCSKYTLHWVIHYQKPFPILSHFVQNKTFLHQFKVLGQKIGLK